MSALSAPSMSAMSSVRNNRAATIAQLQRRGRLIRIAAAGLKESHPHDIHMTVEVPK